MKAENKYKLLIETNSYAGNWNREICAWALGCYWDDPHDWTESLQKTCHNTLGEEFVEEKILELLSCNYDEHGQTCCEIVNSNNLAIYFDKKPSKKVQEIIESRIESFSDAANSIMPYPPKGLKIKEITWFVSSLLWIQMKA